MFIGELTPQERLRMPVVPPRYAVLSSSECRVIGFWAEKNRELLLGIMVLVPNMVNPSVWCLRHVNVTAEGDRFELIADAILKVRNMMERKRMGRLYCWIEEGGEDKENRLFDVISLADFKKRGSALGASWTVEDLLERMFLETDGKRGKGLRYVPVRDFSRTLRGRMLKRLGAGKGDDLFQWTAENPWDRFCYKGGGVIGALTVEVNDYSEFMLHAPRIKAGIHKGEITEMLLRDVFFNVVFGRGQDVLVSARVLNASEMELFEKICGKPAATTTYCLYEK